MFNYNLGEFFIFPLLISILLLALGIFVILKNFHSKINLFFSLIIFCAAIWLYSYAKAYQALEIKEVMWWFKLGYLGIIFMPVTYYHFVNILLQKSNRRWFLLFNYLIGIMFAILLLKTKFLIRDLNRFSWGYYPQAGSIHPYFLIFFLGLVNIASIQIFYAVFLNKETTQTKKEQLKYVLLAFSIFTFACIDFLPNYGIGVYPLGFLPTTLFLTIICYSILRYNLLDIKIAVTRLGIFVTVYSLVLGIPFSLIIWQRKWLINIAGDNWFWIPMILVTVLATAGPTVYLYIQKRAEDRLLQEQHRYQATLRQASAGMGRIKDLKKLLNMIVFVVTRAVQIKHTLIYIYDGKKKKYFLGAFKRRIGYGSFPQIINKDSALIEHLCVGKASLIFEEIRQKAQDFRDQGLLEVGKNMHLIEAELVIPIFIDQDLTAIVAMGKKESGKLYTQDDLSVFSILANQTALAIENAQFYEDMKKTQQQLFQAEKMATIGTMADGLSHQINNRFHALGFIAGDALDTVKMTKDEPMSDKLKEVMLDLERALGRVQENVVQGGEIVQGLLRYTRKGDAGFTAVDFDAIFKSALEMAQFKIKLNELKVIRDYDHATIPQIKGNFTQLQEVFFNLIDNGYDAMMQRKNEAKEPGFQPTLTIHITKLDDGHMQVIFEDNGIGVKDEDNHKLFTPFFTTKLSSKKGTGLGLYVIKKIIEDNHRGTVEMVSKYMHGTQMKLRLPIAIG